MDPLEFLRLHPPFDRLAAAQLARLGEELEIAYAARGTRLLSQGGEPARFLSVVRKGAVRLESAGGAPRLLEEGECFGFPSLIGRSSPLADVTAAEDTLLYQIPGPACSRLVEESPPFARFFLLDLASRLRQAGAGAPPAPGRELAGRVGDLALPAPVEIDPRATVRAAAALMCDAHTDALLVGGETPGILTDRDLRGRVIAAGRGAETAVTEVASRPLQTLPAAASLFEALLFFLEHGVRHAAVEDGGRVVAMLTDTDLLRLAGRSPLAVYRKIERLTAPGRAPAASGSAQAEAASGSARAAAPARPAEAAPGPEPGRGATAPAGEPGGGEPIAAAAAPCGLAGYAREIAGMVAAQAAAGVEAVEVGRIVARLNDALVRRLLVLAEEELGPPPCPYAWLVLGSEGRMEQALLTDQDNALVYEREEARAAAYFATLAGRVTADLLAAGFPPCPGGYMATRWCRPLAGWVELFRGYTATPRAEALLGAAIFFDFRAAAGGLALAPLEDQVRAAGREGIFLAQLARAALRFAPPLGPLHRLREEDGAVDLKRSGIAPIVALARLYALEAGGSARPTLERLEEAVRGGTLSRDGAATLGEAFRFLLRLRLRRQLEALAAGEELDNRVRLAALSPLERVHLKDVFVALRELQQATALRYSTERLG